MITLKKTPQQYLALAVGIAIIQSASTIYGWKGRAVPMAFDKNTKQWSVLLGHDINGFWTDFSEVAQRGEKGNTVAQRALSTQTNNIYNVKNAPVLGSPSRKTESGDIVHFVKVTYIPGEQLYKTATNKINKDNFAWRSASLFITTKRDSDIQIPHKGKPINVSRGVKEMLRVYLPDIIRELTSSISQPLPTSWFGIPNAIYFYDKNKPYYAFTNFADGYPITIDGKEWPTTEQYYQAQKFPNNAQLQEKIRNYTSNGGSAARKAFQTAGTHQSEIRKDWRQVSLGIMLEAVRAKFNQHSDLRQLLLDTQDRVLVEDAGVNDAFFGAGANYTGTNHLGQILMHVRAELKSNTVSNVYTPHDPTYYKSNPYVLQIPHPAYSASILSQLLTNLTRDLSTLRQMMP